jgi:hypothetical protein
MASHNRTQHRHRKVAGEAHFVSKLADNSVDDLASQGQAVAMKRECLDPTIYDQPVRYSCGETLQCPLYIRAGDVDREAKSMSAFYVELPDCPNRAGHEAEYFIQCRVSGPLPGLS